MIRMRTVQILVSVISVIALILGGVWFFMLRMPGKSYQGTMPPLTEEQRLIRGLSGKTSLYWPVRSATAMSERTTKTFVQRLILLRLRFNGQALRSPGRAMR